MVLIVASGASINFLRAVRRVFKAVRPVIFTHLQCTLRMYTRLFSYCFIHISTLDDTLFTHNDSSSVATFSFTEFYVFREYNLFLL